jgi:hypothetical protein
MEDEKAPIGVRMKASENLMERGHGKPIVPQHLHVDGEINHGSQHLQALMDINKEFAAKQRNGKTIEHSSYRDVTSDDEADTQASY